MALASIAAHPVREIFIESSWMFFALIVAVVANVLSLSAPTPLLVFGVQLRKLLFASVVITIWLALTLSAKHLILDVT